MLSWELSHDFTYDPSFATEIEVRFVAESPARTRIDLEHRRFESYGARWEDQLALFESDDGWAYVLRCYAAAAAEGRQQV